MITVLTGVNERPEAFKLFCMNFYGLNPRPRVIVGGPPNSPCEAIARSYGFTYYYNPKQPGASKDGPLGRKINNITEFAAQKPTDFYLYMGMDDLMSQKMWGFYNNYSGERLALADYYFYDVHSKQALHWKGYGANRKNHPIGAGDLISHGAMAKAKFRPLIDTSARWSEFQTHGKMNALGVKTDLMKIADVGGLSLDLKTGDNINKFTVWANSVKLPYDEMIKLGPDLHEIIQSYGK